MDLVLPVYLDNNATTRVDPMVLDAMLPYFTQKYGNAASRSHSYGWAAEEAVNTASEQIAHLLNCEPGEIIYTSGATEGINMALRGVLAQYHAKGKHIITVATEHKAMLDTCKDLEQKGAEVTYLPVDQDGLLDISLLEKSIRPDTILISVMMANNETGVLQDIAAIGTIAKQKGVLLMSDITQAVGKVPVDLQALQVDIAPLSAHKFYGPKGVGAIYLRRKSPRVSMAPLITGGGHQKGIRSGTLNVPGIVGMGKAAELAMNEHETDAIGIRTKRDRLQGFLQSLQGVVVNGSELHRLPNTLNVSFTELGVPTLLGPLCTHIAVSSGSACTSALMEPSFVLKAMDIDDDRAYASIRFSLGRFTTDQEIETAMAHIKKVWLDAKNAI